MTGRKSVAVGDPLTEGASAEATNVHSVGNVCFCRAFRQMVVTRGNQHCESRDTISDKLR